MNVKMISLSVTSGEQWQASEIYVCLQYAVQCQLNIATLDLDVAAALSIATSTPMELGALALHI